MPRGRRFVVRCEAKCCAEDTIDGGGGGLKVIGSFT